MKKIEEIQEEIHQIDLKIEDLHKDGKTQLDDASIERLKQLVWELHLHPDYKCPDSHLYKKERASINKITYNWLVELQKNIEYIHMNTGESIQDILSVLLKVYGFELKKE